MLLFLWLHQGRLDSLLSRRPSFHRWVDLQLMAWTRQLGKTTELGRATHAENILRNFVFSALDRHFDVRLLQASLSMDSDLIDSMRKYFKERKLSEPAEFIHSKVISAVQHLLSKCGVSESILEEVTRRNNHLIFCDVLVENLQPKQFSLIQNYDLKQQFSKISSELIGDIDSSGISEFFSESEASQRETIKIQTDPISLGFVIRDDIGEDPRNQSNPIHTQNVRQLRETGIIPVELNLNMFLEIYSLFDPRNFSSQSNSSIPVGPAPVNRQAPTT